MERNTDRKVTIVATNKTENIKKAQQVYDSKQFQYSFIFLQPKADFLELDVMNKFMNSCDANEL